jgi:hypothetical protein
VTDKPLHVQVAEALGWTDCHQKPHDEEWWGYVNYSQGYRSIPRYDLDWSATGPLITPLAVCNLILALAKAGKL